MDRPENIQKQIEAISDEYPDESIVVVVSKDMLPEALHPQYESPFAGNVRLVSIHHNFPTEPMDYLLVSVEDYGEPKIDGSLAKNIFLF